MNATPGRQDKAGFEMRIVLCYPQKKHYIDQVLQVAPAADVVEASQEEIPQEILNADIFCGHAKVHPLPWKDVVQQGRLRWIQSSAAGLDHCLTDPVIHSNIVVTSASGLFADQVAEQTLALLMGVLRSLPAFFVAATRREFLRLPTRDLRGLTVGIVGLGGNGRRVAQVLAPWKVRILATDMFPDDKPAEVAELYPAEQLDTLLAASDIVVLCVPLNSQTRGLMNAARFARMRPNSIVINVARGQVVVERDLVDALESGHLYGAGLDVTEVEPLPPESKLWELPRVIITPHVGAQSARREDDTTDFFCENLSRYLQGLPLWNVVDKNLGFPKPKDRYVRA